MERELSRLREELSRVTIACNKHEVEAARAQESLRHCKEDLVQLAAAKAVADYDNRQLQAEVASLERERATMDSERERLKDSLARCKAKLAAKEKMVAELRSELQRAEEEKVALERSTKEREQTWQTIRRDVSVKLDDAIKETCRLRRENDNLKIRVKKLKMEKSSILWQMWEKKRSEVVRKGQRDTKGNQDTSRRSREERLQTKILSLELQLFRQARLVELLLDVLQTHDPQFTAQQRVNLTSAFADAGSIPELLSRKMKFSQY